MLSKCSSPIIARLQICSLLHAAITTIFMTDLLLNMYSKPLYSKYCYLQLVISFVESYTRVPLNSCTD